MILMHMLSNVGKIRPEMWSFNIYYFSFSVYSVFQKEWLNFN